MYGNTDLLNRYLTFYKIMNGRAITVPKEKSKLPPPSSTLFKTLLVIPISEINCFKAGLVRSSHS